MCVLNGRFNENGNMLTNVTTKGVSVVDSFNASSRIPHHAMLSMVLNLSQHFALIVTVVKMYKVYRQILILLVKNCKNL